MALACRSCGAGPLADVLSLGRTPLANALRDRDALAEVEPTYPLDLAFCPACTLLQITLSVPPEQLFRDYAYFSSYSDTMLRHATALALRLVRERGLGPSSLVVEAASNDGYLLSAYLASGVPVLGIEPARNVARVARETHGVPTREDFFTLDLARRLAAGGQSADVFHAHNVLAHVPDVDGFVAGVRAVLKPRGVAVLEAPYVKDMLDNGEFDTIYHEHLCYFSLTALDHCFRRHGLSVTGVERVAIHGGTLRLFAMRREDAVVSPEVARTLDEEARWGVASVSAYRDFARRVGEIRDALRNLLGELKAAGRRIAAYGASAKGATLLNYCGIGAETIDFLVDRSAVKQGRYAPGSGLRIDPPHRLLEEMPDYVLLLTWNFADEILAQQQEYRRRGGRFIVPVPYPAVV